MAAENAPCVLLGLVAQERGKALENSHALRGRAFRRAADDDDKNQLSHDEVFWSFLRFPSLFLRLLPQMRMSCNGDR